MSDPAVTTPPGEPAGAHRRRHRALGAAVMAGIIAVTAAVTLLAIRGDDRSAAAAPLDLSTVSENIAGHYRYAQAHGDAFRQIPCWCGCQQYLGHGNLEDCFIRPDGQGFEAHAAGCGVCIGEATIAARMLDEGKTPADVTATVGTEFGTTAITIPPS